jgi:hypothetical protein
MNTKLSNKMFAMTSQRLDDMLHRSRDNQMSWFVKLRKILKKIELCHWIWPLCSIKASLSIWLEVLLIFKYFSLSIILNDYARIKYIIIASEEFWSSIFALTQILSILPHCQSWREGARGRQKKETQQHAVQGMILYIDSLSLYRILMITLSSVEATLPPSKAKVPTFAVAWANCCCMHCTCEKESRER